MLDQKYNLNPNIRKKLSLMLMAFVFVCTALPVSARKKLKASTILIDRSLSAGVTHFEEPRLPRSTVVPATLRTPIDTRTSRVQDVITVQTANDLFIGEDNIIPANSYLRGIITKIERPGRFHKKPKIEVAFHTVSVPGENGVMEHINFVGNIKQSQLMKASTAVSDSSKTYAEKAKLAGGAGAVVGAGSAFAYTSMAEPFAGLGMGGMLNNLLLLGGAGAGFVAGTALISRDDARIETGAPLEITVSRPSKI